MDGTTAARQQAVCAQARLPAQMTATLGREQELAALVALLHQEDARLVTLTGPGGVGKTRLGLEAARAVQEHFADGVFFVSLAPLRDQGQVLLAVAQALGIDTAGGQPLERRLRDYIHDRHCLLLLDNFEHLLMASPLVSELLAYAPRVTVLATSREMLHLYGEREIVVHPLALPQAGRADGGPGAAVALFVARAQAIKPTFALTHENDQAIAEICIQLDGLPLAIELAAARIKLLGPQAILARLSSRLRLLTGGARDLPQRQQTLRNTLDWSYTLLTREEQAFFQRLGVFVGSWTIEAAEAVTGSLDALYMLTSLVDKSLVHVLEEPSLDVRFHLLETVREYACACLDEQHEVEQTQARHAAYYLRLAEEVATRLQSADQQASLLCLDREAANLWAALGLAIERADAALALRLAGALSAYVPLRSVSDNDRRWFEEVLALPGAHEVGAQRACVLYAAGVMARMRGDVQMAKERLLEGRDVARQAGDAPTLAAVLGMLAQLEISSGRYEQARALVEEGLQAAERGSAAWCRGILHRIYGTIASRQGNFAMAQTRYSLSLMVLTETGDRRSVAETLVHLGSMMRLRGKLRTAHYLYARALRLLQEVGDRWGQLFCLNRLGEALFVQGEQSKARAGFLESLELATTLGDRAERMAALTGLGQVALSTGEQGEAARCLKEALRLARAIDDVGGQAAALCGLGDLQRLRGEWSGATTYYTRGLELATATKDRLGMISLLHGLGEVARMQGMDVLACTRLKQSLHLAWEIGNHVALTAGIEALAWLCVQANQPEHGALLLGAAHELRETLQTPHSPISQKGYERELAALKEAIGQQAFAESWGHGRSLLLTQVMALGVAPVCISASRAPRRRAAPYNLTARELDVLRLLAEGHADARIARILVVSPRTVNTHLRSIYAKLGVSSRSAATRLALEQKLIEH